MKSKPANFVLVVLTLVMVSPGFISSAWAQTDEIKLEYYDFPRTNPLRGV
jgi:hypothetical protein